MDRKESAAGFLSLFSVVTPVRLVPLVLGLVVLLAEQFREILIAIHSGQLIQY